VTSILETGKNGYDCDAEFDARTKAAVDGTPSEKCRYYVAQNKGEGKGAFPADYMERVFIPWRDDPERIEREFGTHPYGGGGTQAFAGEHPEAVARRMAGRV